MFTFDLPQNFCIYVTPCVVFGLHADSVCVSKLFWIDSDCGVIFKICVCLCKCFSPALHFFSLVLLQLSQLCLLGQECCDVYGGQGTVVSPLILGSV